MEFDYNFLKLAIKSIKNNINEKHSVIEGPGCKVGKITK